MNNKFLHTVNMFDFNQLQEVPQMNLTRETIIFATPPRMEKFPAHRLPPMMNAERRYSEPMNLAMHNASDGGIPRPMPSRTPFKPYTPEYNLPFQMKQQAPNVDRNASPRNSRKLPNVNKASVPPQTQKFKKVARIEGIVAGCDVQRTIPTHADKNPASKPQHCKGVQTNPGIFLSDAEYKQLSGSRTKLTLFKTLFDYVDLKASQDDDTTEHPNTKNPKRAPKRKADDAQSVGNNKEPVLEIPEGNAKANLNGTIYEKVVADSDQYKIKLWHQFKILNKNGFVADNMSDEQSVQMIDTVAKRKPATVVREESIPPKDTGIYYRHESSYVADPTVHLMPASEIVLEQEPVHTAQEDNIPDEICLTRHRNMPAEAPTWHHPSVYIPPQEQPTTYTTEQGCVPYQGNYIADYPYGGAQMHNPQEQQPVPYDPQFPQNYQYGNMGNGMPGEEWGGYNAYNSGM